MQKTDSLPKRDPSKTNEEQGLSRKFDVRRTDDSDPPGGKHHGGGYFVLEVDNDLHAKAALAAYADSVGTTNPQLARDIRDRYGLPSPAAESEEEHLVSMISLAVSKYLMGHATDTTVTLDPFDPSLSNDLARTAYQEVRKSLDFSLDFYSRRHRALQQAQKNMRDPERTMVCDILANGTLLNPPGDRYTVVEKAKPFTSAQVRRLWINSPEYHKDAYSFEAFKRIVGLVMAAADTEKEGPAVEPEEGAPGEAGLRWAIGHALSEALGNPGEDGAISIDPFDSDNIDPLVDAVVGVIKTRTTTVAYRYWSSKWHDWEFSQESATPTGEKGEPLCLPLFYTSQRDVLVAHTEKEQSNG